MPNPFASRLAEGLGVPRAAAAMVRALAKALAVPGETPWNDPRDLARYLRGHWTGEPERLAELLSEGGARVLEQRPGGGDRLYPTDAFVAWAAADDERRAQEASRKAELRSLDSVDIRGTSVETQAVCENASAAESVQIRGTSVGHPRDIRGTSGATSRPRGNSTTPTPTAPTAVPAGRQIAFDQSVADRDAWHRWLRRLRYDAGWPRNVPLSPKLARDTYDWVEDGLNTREEVEYAFDQSEGKHSPVEFVRWLLGRCQDERAFGEGESDGEIEGAVRAERAVGASRGAGPDAGVLRRGILQRGESEPGGDRVGQGAQPHDRPQGVAVADGDAAAARPDAEPVEPYPWDDDGPAVLPFRARQEANDGTRRDDPGTAQHPGGLSRAFGGRLDGRRTEVGRGAGMVPDAQRTLEVHRDPNLRGLAVEPDDPFGDLTVAQRETLHTFVLGQERYLLEDPDTVNDLKQLVREFDAKDLSWVRQQARRQQPRIWPVWPSEARTLLAGRGIAANVPEEVARSDVVPLASEWQDWLDPGWRPKGEQQAQWEGLLGDLRAKLPSARTWLANARLVSCMWDCWVITLPTKAAAQQCQSVLRATVRTALADVLGVEGIDVRFVCERTDAYGQPTEARG